MNSSVRHTGQPEAFQEESLAQEVADLLGIALAGYRSGDSGNDQEAYVVTIYGTQLRLVAATFTASYLRTVQSDVMPAFERQDIRRSKFFELKDPDGRKEALRMLYGLGKYILSDQAEMEQLRHASSSLAVDYRERSARKRQRLSAR